MPADRLFWRMFALAVLPLPLALGLKLWMVDPMMTSIADPAFREVVLQGSGRFTPDWFAIMRSRDDVAFVAEQTRSLSREVSVGRADAIGRSLPATLMVSGPGDAALGNAAPPPALGGALLTWRAAYQAGLHPGQDLLVWIDRPAGGQPPRWELRLHLAAVAPERADGKAALYVPLSVATDLEDAGDGLAVPALGWPGGPPRERHYFAGFRLYARSASHVAKLEHTLLAQELNVISAARAIAAVQRLEAPIFGLFGVVLVACTVGVAAAARRREPSARLILALCAVVGPAALAVNLAFTVSTWITWSRQPTGGAPIETICTPTAVVDAVCTDAMLTELTPGQATRLAEPLWRRPRADAKERALALLQQAWTRDGHAPAALALGRLYDPETFVANGPLRAPDPVRALALYAAAAWRGVPEAETARTTLIQRLRSATAGSGPAADAAYRALREAGVQ